MSKRETIPGWKVQQAFTIESHPIKPGTWFSITQKINGVRATYYKGHMIGRSGTVLPGLEHIEKTLAEFGDYVFDGELVLKDTIGLTDNEAFRKAAGIINSDSGNKTEIGFSIFDAIPTNEFDSYDSQTYRKRRALLDEISEKLYESDCVEVLLPLYQGTDQSRIWSLLDMVTKRDCEGLMVNLDTLYLRKRHSGILKVKKFYTMDLRVTGLVEGEGRLQRTLGSILVDYKGNQVGVGTGFTDAQRDDIWNNPEMALGALAEVKYKEISYDKNTGKQSLQFPVFIGLRSDKSDVSYG